MRLQFSWLLAEEMTKKIYIIIFELKWLNKIVDFAYFTDLGMESISWQKWLPEETGCCIFQNVPGGMTSWFSYM